MFNHYFKKLLLLNMILIFVLSVSGCAKGNTVNSATSNNTGSNDIITKEEGTLRTFVVYNPANDNKQDNSATDTILIYEPLKQVKPVMTIHTGITPEMRDHYTLIGNRLFFFNTKDMMIEWLDFDGTIHKISSTKGDYDESPLFIVSEKENKIAWVAIEYSDSIKSTLYVSNLDGQEKRELHDMTDPCKIIRLIKWSNTGDAIFFGESLTGLGGLVVYRNYEDILKINVNNGETKNVTGKIEPQRDEADNTDYLSDISPNEEMISYFNKINGHFKLFVRSVNTFQEEVYDVPDGEDYLAAGNAYFSSDNNYLFYEIALKDPKRSLASGEYITKYAVVDLHNKTSKIYDASDFPYIIIDKHWLDKSNQTLAAALEDMKQYE